MKGCRLLFIVIFISALITAGCVNENKTPVEPIVGNWSFVEGNTYYALNFFSDGRVEIINNTASGENVWVKIKENEYSIGGIVLLVYDPNKDTIALAESLNTPIYRQGKQPIATQTTIGIATAKPTITEGSTTATGDLAVYSSPPGATIFLDDENYGTTDAELKGIPVGVHSLELHLGGYYASGRYLIDIYEGERTFKYFELEPNPAIRAPTTIQKIVIKEVGGGVLKEEIHERGIGSDNIKFTVTNPGQVAIYFVIDTGPASVVLLSPTGNTVLLYGPVRHPFIVTKVLNLRPQTYTVAMSVEQGVSWTLDVAA